MTGTSLTATKDPEKTDVQACPKSLAATLTRWPASLFSEPLMWQQQAAKMAADGSGGRCGQQQAPRDFGWESQKNDACAVPQRSTPIARTAAPRRRSRRMTIPDTLGMP